METTGVGSDRITGTSGATIIGIVGLVASSIGLPLCVVFALDLLTVQYLSASAFMEWQASSWDLLVFRIGMAGVPLALFGTTLGVVAVFMARRDGEKSRSARLAVVVGLLGVVLAAVALGHDVWFYEYGG